MNPHQTAALSTEMNGFENDKKATNAAIVCGPFICASDTSSLILPKLIVDHGIERHCTPLTAAVASLEAQTKERFPHNNPTLRSSSTTNRNKMTQIRLFFLTAFCIQGLLLPSAFGTPTPALMYHGMGDTSGGSISEIKTFLEEEIPGIYVTSIRMGNNTEEDFLSSYFMNLNQQVSNLQ